MAADWREAREPRPVGFADLRRRVGVRDSGRFRYHLQKLRGRFVEKTEEGYELTHAGMEVVTAILTGTYTERVSRGPTELDSDCFVCGEPALASYEDSVCHVTCANDHALFQWSVPPNAAEGATLTEIVELGELLAFQAIELALEGTCPNCYGPIETEVLLREDDPRPGFRAECDTCGGQVVGPVGFCLLVDPEVAAFCRRHGRTLRDRHVWELPFVQDGSTVSVLDSDPVRVEVGVAFDAETLHVTVDETGAVVATEK
ncbi:DUF7351 domain-containing protein [Halorussus halophilus]|nr:ArsR family transcriptional regulator [Halorussus halophilus]